jgi:3-oxoacyl-[acyl-carrier protein] reductase
MIKQKSGNILNILTENVVGKPQSGVSDYVCAKYALLGLTKTLAVEYAGKNIRVNAISPGMVETKMLKNLPPKAIEITKETTPLGKLTTPNDIANAVLFLISDRAANITGVNLVICGGTSMN